MSRLIALATAAFLLAGCAEPARPRVIGLVDPGFAPGSEPLETLLKANNFDFRYSLLTQLASTLAAEGYQVLGVEMPRDGIALHDSEHFLTPPVGGRIDAYLDISVSAYGYAATGDAGYRPFAVADVQLVAADGDGTILKRERVTYDPGQDAGFSFARASEIEANPQRAVSGMDAAALRTGKAIGELFR